MSVVRQIPPEVWVDRTVGTSRAWQFDRAALSISRRANAGRQTLNDGSHKHMVTKKVNELARASAARHRATDEFERARSFLQRSVPVYAAEISGGPKGKFIVVGKVVSRDALLDMARAKGFAG